MQRVRLAGVSRVSAGMNILPRVYVFSPKSTPAPVHNFAGESSLPLTHIHHGRLPRAPGVH